MALNPPPEVIKQTFGHCNDINDIQKIPPKWTSLFACQRLETKGFLKFFPTNGEKKNARYLNKQP